MKEVFFTFDDGPSDITPCLLDILKSENIKATFFVTNQFQRLDLLQQICKEGHLLCLHSYTHDYRKVYSSIENYFHDLHKLEAAIYETTGLKSRIMRFPGGTSNIVSQKYGGFSMSQLVREARKRGYRIFDWNCENGDGLFLDENRAEYERRGIQSIEGHDCAVFLSHNRPIDKESIYSIPGIIKWCRENGYAFRRIDEYGSSELTHIKL